MDKHVTAVVINWCTARRTLGAINNFKSYYPDIPLIVVDDASNIKDRSEFFGAYNGRDVNPELEFDVDNDKLKNIPGTIFLQAPDFNAHPKSHGHCVDYAMKFIKTKWMFHFHSDYRMTKPGLLEHLFDGLDDNYVGAGDNKTRHSRCPALVSVAALYNVDLGKKHNVTFKPVIYYDDDTISEFPGEMDKSKNGGIAIEAGSYYVGRLASLGYKIKWMNNPHSEYGVHLRKGDKLWNQLY